MRKIAFLATAMLLCLASTQTFAEGIGNENAGYISYQLSSESKNFCVAVNGMANFHRLGPTVGIPSPTWPGTENWCNNVFKPEDQEKVKLEISKFFQENHEVNGHIINTNPSYGGIRTSDALIALKPHGRILVCELFWRWGSSPPAVITTALSQVPDCDIDALVKSVSPAR